MYAISELMLFLTEHRELSGVFIEAGRRPLFIKGIDMVEDRHWTRIMNAGECDQMIYYCFVEEQCFSLYTDGAASNEMRIKGKPNSHFRIDAKHQSGLVSATLTRITDEE